MAAEYVITQVETRTLLDEQLNPEEGYRVTFRIPSLDIRDHVDVPARLYEAEEVRRRIEEVVALHKELLG